LSKQEVINLNRQFFDPIRSKVNQFNENSNNSMEHETAKFQIFMYLRKQGHSVLVEPELKFNGGRPDIVDLNEALIYEIYVSENIKKTKEDKSSRYPFTTLFYSPDEINKLIKEGK
jgi:hypothetical protein